MELVTSPSKFKKLSYIRKADLICQIGISLFYIVEKDRITESVLLPGFIVRITFFPLKSNLLVIEIDD